MSTNHVLPLPKAIIGLRAVQLATAVAILGLTAYVVTYFAFDAACLSLFTAIATMIITIYNIVACTGAPVMYNYWAILSLDIFALCFWIISMSYMAWTTAAATYWYEDTTSYTDTGNCDYTVDGYCVKKRALAARDVTDAYTYRNSMAAAAGLGGLEFILFIITLVFVSVHLHRHRKAGGHCTPSRAGPSAPPTGPIGGPAPVYSEAKHGHEMYAQQPVQYVQHPDTQPQQYYAGQQVQAA